MVQAEAFIIKLLGTEIKTIMEIKKIIKENFDKKKILVIGDLMVDEYILGSVSRISPEAPVPILNYKGREKNAGGAANVALNINALGGGVIMAGVAAEDENGQWLRRFLHDNGIDTSGIVEEKNKRTTVKTRFATKGQQLLRMDWEDNRGIMTDTRQRLLECIALRVKELNGVVISDYCKGVFADADFVKEIIKLCSDNGIIIAIDSKSRNIEAFAGADFVKPNNLELENAVSIKITDDASLDEAGAKYLRLSRAKNVIVTRGANGISIFSPGNKRRDYASRAIQVFDVTGAGDTVISAVTLGLTSGLSIDESVMLANAAAGIVIGKRGTAVVSMEELLKKIDEG